MARPRTASSRETWEQTFDVAPLDPKRWDRDLDPILDQHAGSRTQAIEAAIQRHYKQHSDFDCHCAFLTARDYLAKRIYKWKVIPYTDMPQDLVTQYGLVNHNGALAWTGVGTNPSKDTVVYLVCARPVAITENLTKQKAEKTLHKIKEAQVQEAVKERGVSTEANSENLVIEKGDLERIKQIIARDEAVGEVKE